ncbi:MAG TPA: acetate--CoA ligase family protein [Methanosarcina sp.]|nr:acetate--CoA ligase family protein [Methanosarcina sp.]
MNQVDPIPHASRPDRVLASRIFEAAITKNRHILSLEVFGILKAYGIPMVKTAFAKTAEEAIIAAEKIGYPLVMKVVSPQISHKSDAGGIRLSLQNAAEVKAAYQDMRVVSQRNCRMCLLKVYSFSQCSQAAKK